MASQETIDHQQMRAHREAHQRLTDGRIHKPVPESLAVLWKQYGQRADSLDWIAAHTKAITRWRTEGDCEKKKGDKLITLLPGIPVRVSLKI